MTSADDLHPEARLAESARKIRPPYRLDPTLCLYSPQANRDALEHPQVKSWLEFIGEEWEPEPGKRMALLIPCTKYKPYNTSREHRAINAALLDAGWEPEGDSTTPAELLALLDDGEEPVLLHNGPLRKGDVRLDRIVMSEPLALVPYPYIYEWNGRQSVATSYDDPGLFEARGTSVSPERPDSTATALANGKWRWGPNEREAYVRVHNRLADLIATVLGRVGSRYAAIGAWVSPGLTHRSFLANQALRRTECLPLSRRGPDGPLALRGALDAVPGSVTIMPTVVQQAEAKEAFAKRLAHQGRVATRGAVAALYARGDGCDTPLGLPESLLHLTRWLDAQLNGLRRS